MIGYAMNLTLPRAGEVSRAYSLQRSEKVPFAIGIGSIVAERIIDIFIMLLITLFTVLVALDDLLALKKSIENTFSLNSDTRVPWFWIILCAMVICVFLVFRFSEKLRYKLKLFLVDFRKGLLSVFNMKAFWPFFLHTVLIWFGFFAYSALAFLAIPETSKLGLDSILVSFVVGTFGISLTNGGIGVFPLLYGLVIQFYLNEKLGNNALAIGYALGMLLWCSQQLLVITLGVFSFLYIRKNFQEEITL
jgi:glycosyltransferase 2 family protein